LKEEFVLKKKNTPTGLIIGIALAVVVFILNFSVLSGAQPVTVKYYQAKVAVSENTKIGENFDKYFTTQDVPESVQLKNAVRADTKYEFKDQDGKSQQLDAKEFLKKQEVYFPIVEGQFDFLHNFKSQLPVGFKSIGQEIPADKKTVTLESNLLKSFGGTLKPGDNIDLTFTIETIKPNTTEKEKRSITLLQNVPVFKLIYDAQSQASTTEGTKVPPNGIIVLLDQKQVELFNLVGSNSYTISVSANSDITKYNTNGISASEILSNKDIFFYTGSTAGATTNNSTTTPTAPATN
jgi:Flp pilus assembly protein CpaB